MKSYTVYAKWNNGDETQVDVKALNPVLARKAVSDILKDAESEWFHITAVRVHRGH